MNPEGNNILDVSVDDNCVQDHEIQFPWGALTTDFLEERTGWMVISGEYLRYSFKEIRESDDDPIFLQGWKVAEKFHALMRNYGRLFAVSIRWSNHLIPINVVALENLYVLEEFPHNIKTGDGLAYLISKRHFDVYRDNAKEMPAPGEIDVGKRLLFLCLISRGQFPDLTLLQFANWSAEQVLDQISWWEERERTVGTSRVSAIDAGMEHGILDDSVVEVSPNYSLTPEGAVGGAGISVGCQDQAVVMWEKSEVGEPVKRNHGGDKESGDGGSPVLAEPVRNDMDEVLRTRKKRKSVKRMRKFKGKRGIKRRRMSKITSPPELTSTQKRGVMKTLLEEFVPGLSDELIAYNQDLGLGIGTRNEEMERKLREHQRYGPPPGELSLSPSDIRDILSLDASGNSSKGENVSEDATMWSSTVQSFYSPRAELSGLLASSPMVGSGSGERDKNWREISRSEASSMMSFSGSPFLADKGQGSRVISVSSSATSRVEQGSMSAPPSLMNIPIMNMRGLWGGHFGNYVDDECFANREERGEEEGEVNGNDDDVTYGPGQAEEGNNQA